METVTYMQSFFITEENKQNFILVKEFISIYEETQFNFMSLRILFILNLN